MSTPAHSVAADAIALAVPASGAPAPGGPETGPGAGGPGTGVARPSWLARLVGRPLFWAIALPVLFGLPLVRSIVRRVPPPPPLLGAVPAFALTDQQGKTFGTEDLRGRVWVADFIFTTCPTACPILTEKMGGILRRARFLGPELHAVSFTVDPETDTPERLADYARKHGAPPQKWSFLTGPMDRIQAAVTDGFKIAMGREKKGDFWEIFHGERFVLVDRNLQIRGYYDASTPSLDKLLDDLGSLVNGR